MLLVGGVSYLLGGLWLTVGLLRGRCSSRRSGHDAAAQERRAPRRTRRRGRAGGGATPPSSRRSRLTLQRCGQQRARPREPACSAGGSESPRSSPCSPSGASSSPRRGSSRSKPAPATGRSPRWFLHFAMRRSVATHTLGLEAPPLDDPRLVLQGRRPLRDRLPSLPRQSGPPAAPGSRSR